MHPVLKKNVTKSVNYLGNVLTLQNEKNETQFFQN